MKFIFYFINFQNVKIFTFTGNSKIDVPANSQRDYRAEFHSYKESKYNFKVNHVGKTQIIQIKNYFQKEL